MNSINLINLMNRRSYLPKRIKLFKRMKQSGAEEFNKQDRAIESICSKENQVEERIPALEDRKI